MKSATIVRTVTAEPQAAFEAFTTPNRLARWFAPTAELDVEASCEAVPGGAWRVEMRDRSGNAFAAGGTFLAIDPPRFFEWSWRWEFEALASMGETRVVVTIERQNSGSRIEVTHSGFPNDETAENHRAGWENSLSRLADLFVPRSPHRVSTLLALHRRVLTETMAGVSDADLVRRPHDKAPGMLGIAGQIARGRCSLAKILGLDAEFPFPALTQPDADGADCPSWDDVLVHFTGVTHGMYDFLHRMDDAALRRPHGMALPINDPTMSGLLDYAVDEEARLLGQLSLVRAMLGLEAPNADS